MSHRDFVSFGTTVGSRSDRRMFERLLAGAILVSLISLPSLAQTHSPFPVDITTPRTPQSVMVDGRARLVYELHLAGFVPWAIELTGIDVFGGTTPLASYRGDVLDKMVVPAEQLFHTADSTASTDKPRSIGVGHGAIVFFDLTLDAGDHPPAELRHRFTFSFEGSNGKPVERIVDGVIVPVVQEPTTVLRAPLREGRWVAFNAFSNGASPDHRRAVNAVDGRLYIAQRFAVDWARLGPDGRLFHGDAKSNANFYGYGAEVLAVADARVSDVKDGLPDNVGSTARSSRVITLENVTGNGVILDIGHGSFAVYAHMQPGSLTVKVGDHVKAGQVLGLLGNSGNSDGPHLHFQLTDANSPLGSEGIPYELESFTQLGAVSDDPAVQDNGQVLLSKEQEKPVVHRQEFPVNNAVVTFP